LAVRIALLRGINLGPTNRVAMAELRDLFVDAGYADVRTYVQSGNAVFSSGKKPATLASELERLIADRFGLELLVVVRTREELAEVVKRNPLVHLVDEPKRYQVSFLDRDPPAELEALIDATVEEPEACVVVGREIYAWHPDGVARSKLWAKLAAKKLAVGATARNWNTVTTLLEMADELDGS
jgi:uncharacterized protein (DUF1697 family)